MLPAFQSLCLGALAVLAVVSARGFATPQPVRLIAVPAGVYVPVLRGSTDPERESVAPFLLDEHPVTNADFLAFVTAQPRWRRSRVSPLFADRQYLAHWSGDLEPGPAAPADSPVVNLSWFAARAYAAWVGKRLPTTAEWERVAATGYTADGAADPAWSARQMQWFAAPAPDVLPAVGGGRANFLGIRDLNTLVWEWVDDFSTALTTGESRGDTGLERDFFCGSGAAGARDPRDYAAFMRAGFRSSLRANYTVPTLGFRCARDLPSK